jgi:hypothetical protein
LGIGDPEEFLGFVHTLSFRGEGARISSSKPFRVNTQTIHITSENTQSAKELDFWKVPRYNPEEGTIVRKNKKNPKFSVLGVGIQNHPFKDITIEDLQLQYEGDGLESFEYIDLKVRKSGKNIRLRKYLSDVTDNNISFGPLTIPANNNYILAFSVNVRDANRGTSHRFSLGEVVLDDPSVELTGDYPLTGNGFSIKGEEMEESDFEMKVSISANEEPYGEEVVLRNREEARVRIEVKHEGEGDGSVLLKRSITKATNGGSIVLKYPKIIECPMAECVVTSQDGVGIFNLWKNRTAIVEYSVKAYTSEVPEGESSTIKNILKLYLESTGVYIGKESVNVILSSESKNLIENSSFEDDGFWKDFGPGSSTKVPGGYTGARSLKLISSDYNSPTGTKQSVNLYQSTTTPVRIEGYIKGEDIKVTPFTSIGASLYVKIHLRNSSEVVELHSPLNEGTFDWKRVEFDTKGVVDRPIEYIEVIPIIERSKGTVYFDDIVVREIK